MHVKFRPLVRLHPAGLVTACLFGLFALPTSAAALQAEGDRYVLPPARVQELFETDKNFANLDNPDPSDRYFAIPHVTELSTLVRMSEETYRLAMLELRPRVDRPWHLDTYGLDGLQIYSLAEKTFRSIRVPDGALISDLTWSPSGDEIAFLTHLRDRTEVWTADPADGRAERRADLHVMTSLGSSSRGQGSAPSRMVQWAPDGRIVTLVTPPDRGAEPRNGAVPAGPVVRETRDEETPNPTYPYLLRTGHDADLFEHYTTSRIAVLERNGRSRLIGPPGMYESVSVSPDGQHILATRVTRPFSFIAPYFNFPRVTEVLDFDGNVVAELHRTELREGRSGGRFGRRTAGDEPRDWAWRPDGSGLTYLQRAPREDSADEDDRPDRIMWLAPPFDTATATVAAESSDPLSDVVYSEDGTHVFAEVRKDGETGLAYWNLSDGLRPERRLAIDWYDPDALLELPGELWTNRTGNGLDVVRPTSDGQVLLRGPGYAEDYRPTPFVDRLQISTGQSSRLFTGAKDSFDQPLVALAADGSRMIVRREGVHDFPDSFLWQSGRWENLTENRDPFPDITAAERVDFSFERRDGLEIRGRISLPVDYVEGTRVPAIFWTYPREFRSEDAFTNATIRSRNLNAHTQLSWLRWSDIWLTQGYALVYPDIPIVGEDYNDFYIANMVDGMYAAVREVDRLGYVDIDRIGHGGHSYGAFATANFLAHTPFFKAGIAGDGAYNRTLTPQGFQAEPRNIWEAPHVYIEMSPFFKADQINTPLLMYHGADDNNTGTFPIQSERLMQALQGLGKTAVLYMYPFESHTPRAIENNLDMWARWLAWFDHYVKGTAGDDLVGGR